jgi:hypothetical protein
MTRFLLRSFLVLLASLTVACSSFDQRWKEAGLGKDGMTRWDGQWKSGKNLYPDGAYHHGRLRCVLAPQPDKKLNAYFHANWLMFSGNFDLTLRPVKAGPRRQNAGEYEGTHELPAMFGGLYHYRAKVSGDHFKADYTCSIDQGIFELTRVK